MDTSSTESALARLLADPRLIETLAAYEHNEHWSGWETYRAQNQDGRHPSGESYRDRWRRLRQTPYADLTEAERESDRIEVRKYLAVIASYFEGTPLADLADLAVRLGQVSAGTGEAR